MRVIFIVYVYFQIKILSIITLPQNIDIYYKHFLIIISISSSRPPVGRLVGWYAG